MISESEPKVSTIIFVFFYAAWLIGWEKNHAFSRGKRIERHRIYILYASVEANKAISPGAPFKYRLSVGLTE